MTGKKQNRSNAVMASRFEDEDSLDFFPTQPWATRALCEWLERRHPIGCQSVWEPACGMFDMVRPLREYFLTVEASDIFDHNAGTLNERPRIFDYLSDEGVRPQHDWVITNPPFDKVAERFVARALQDAKVGCAIFARTNFLEGVGRYENMFAVWPPTNILQFVERVPLHKGKLTDTGSTATAYCWFIWVHGAPREPLDWIPPCRKRLERYDDYFWA